MSDFDALHSFDISPTQITRDFVGLCIGILTVVIVILIVAICKWSRCLCLKENSRDDPQSENLSSVMFTDPTPSNRHPSQCQQTSNPYQYTSTTRDGFLSPPPTHYNGHRPKDVKVPRVTITTLPVQPSQQIVPRLSLSPQVSGSSIAHSTYSFK